MIASNIDHALRCLSALSGGSYTDSVLKDARAELRALLAVARAVGKWRETCECPCDACQKPNAAYIRLAKVSR
jgi:hypothetical protein